MRFGVLLLTAASYASGMNLAGAQSVGNSITVDHKEVGKVQMQIQRYDQALGVISQLSRSQLSNIECNGVCYFPNSSKPIAWKCECGKKCDLHCTVNPPVGGCN
jgi:hypothetical protein